MLQAQFKAPQTPPLVQAGVSFDYADADIILCSSNNVEFRVHKLILSLASQFFKSIFSLPQSADTSTAPHSSEQRDGIPLKIVPLSEESEIVDLLLRVCYPIRKPKVTDLAVLTRLLHAAEKYEVDACNDVAEVTLRSELQTQAVRVYAIACRFGFDNITVRALSLCRGMTVRDAVDKTDCAELDLITVRQYRSMLVYCRESSW